MPNPADLYRLPCRMCGQELRVNFVDFKSKVRCPNCGEETIPQLKDAEQIFDAALASNVLTGAGVAPVEAEPDLGLVGDFSMRRLLAAWADMACGFAFGYIVAQPFAELGRPIQGTLFVLGYFLLFFLSEGLFGRTLGKFLLELRVVTLDGAKPSWWQTAVRTFWRLIEVNPLFVGGLPAGISIYATKSNQRIGDRFARTLVVSEDEL